MPDEDPYDLKCAIPALPAMRAAPYFLQKVLT